MSRYHYEILCDVDMTFLPSMDKLVNSVNDSMEKFGFSEKVGIKSTDAPLVTFSSTRELTTEERHMIAAEYQKGLDSSDLLKGKFRVTEVKLKS